IDALPAGLVVLDPDFKVLQENAQAVELLGKSVVGSDWRAVISAPDFAEPLLSGEFNYVDGKRLSISHNQYGTGRETILLLTDITESHRLRRLINREERLSALGEMAARLAHQIRTPLTTAILYLSHLSGGRQLEIRENDTIQKILDRMRQIERQVEGMLSYIRGDAVAAEAFCLTQLLQEVKDATMAQIEQREGSIALNIKTGLTQYGGDREAILNAVSNLVENSLQAKPNQPLIIVSLDRTDDEFLITVRDNGPGIIDANADKLFDPFFSTKVDGNGLGLAVVMSAVKAHGGDVCASNDPEGGAVFELRLPFKNQANDIPMLEQE
ncbi:MAG: ATP-binding protein, partial [Pseudomonadales bacterium]|nr:ATP-binding protein [Pseudomonadales bacterium]